MRIDPYAGTSTKAPAPAKVNLLPLFSGIYSFIGGMIVLALRVILLLSSVLAVIIAAAYALLPDLIFGPIDDGIVILIAGIILMFHKMIESFAEKF